MLFKEKIENQIAFLKRNQRQINEELGKMPKGSLKTVKKNSSTFYYATNGGKLKSLLHNSDLVDIYLRKKLLLSQKRVIDDNLQLLSRIIPKYKPLQPTEYKWDTIKAEQNMYKPEERIHNYKGILYRSKSEVLIATILTSYGIEFKYEARIELDGKSVYPDFVVKNPRTGEVFIWEHFGLTYDPSYINRIYEKLKLYHTNGYLIGRDLIVSIDTEEGSIDADYIERMVKTYLQ